jgi:hypothetical protein
VFRPYRRSAVTGVFDALLEGLAELVERDRTADMINSTVVRAHHCAAGIKGELRKQRPLAGRAVGSRPSSTPGATPKAARSPLS